MLLLVSLITVAYIALEMGGDGVFEFLGLMEMGSVVDLAGG